MNKDTIFTRLGYEKVVEAKRTYYKSPGGKLYDLEITNERITVLRAYDETSSFERLMGIFRIYPLEDMYEIIYLCLKSIEEDEEAYMATYTDPKYHADFIRGTLGRRLGPQELENLCIIYYETVRIGDKTLDFTEIVKEVLKIHAMPASEFVNPELHELLLKVPDTYFDFIQGTERNTQRKMGLQNRYIQYMREHPNAMTTDLMVYGSMLNADMTYKDDWIQQVIDYVNSEKTFSIYGIKHGANEIIQADNKHDWHTFMKYVKGTGYYFRQVKSLVFVDYMDSCIRAAMLAKIDEDIAMFFDIAEQKPEFDGVYEALLAYTEKLVCAAGLHNIVAFVKPEFVPLYESLGYELSEDEIIDNPYEIQCDRAFMWKKF